MLLRSVFAGLCLVGLCLMGMTSMALAQNSSQPFGKGFDNWSFTREKEAGGITNCRAFHRVDGRDDIMAMRTNGVAYVSVRAEGRKGKFPNSIVVPLREPATGLQWDMTVEANGGRMWMTMPSPAAIEMIAARGGYSVLLGGSEDRDDVNFGKSERAAWKRVKECIVASGG